MSGWRRVTVGDLAVEKGITGGPFGSSLGGKDYENSGVPVIRGNNLDPDRRFNTDEFVFVSPEKADTRFAGNLAEPGDVIVTQRGTLGQVGIVPPTPFDRYVISQSQMRLRVDRDLAHPEFVYYCLRSPGVVREIRGQAISAGVPHINLGILRSLEVDLPPLAEQRAIAAVLGALDDKIAVNERVTRASNELCHALYREATNHPGQLVELAEIADLHYGRALPKAKRVPGDVPVYGSSGRSGTHHTPLVTGPGIVVGRKGTVGAVHWSRDSFFPIDTTFHASPKHGDVSLEYLYYTLDTLPLDTLNSDSAVPGLNRSVALSRTVRLPPPERIAEFTHNVRPMFAHVFARRDESRALADLRDTLLGQLVSGKLRVADAERVVSETT
ncbi:restriction endonuclease subunit S [Halostreptopolyspora alba]